MQNQLGFQYVTVSHVRNARGVFSEFKLDLKTIRSLHQARQINRVWLIFDDEDHTFFI